MPPRILACATCEREDKHILWMTNGPEVRGRGGYDSLRLVLFLLQQIAEPHFSCYNSVMAQTALLEIPVTLRLSKDAEAKLAGRAAASGMSVPAYLSTLVESLVESPRCVRGNLRSRLPEIP